MFNKLKKKRNKSFTNKLLNKHILMSENMKSEKIIMKILTNRKITHLMKSNTTNPHDFR